MANPTTLTRPKVIQFKLSGFNSGTPFQVWNVTTDEIIKVDNAGNTLTASSTGGLFDTSWFSEGVSTGNKLIVNITGNGYSSGSVVITEATDSQSISTITAVTTALPAVNM